LFTPLKAEALVALRDEQALLELPLARLLLTRDCRRWRREHLRLRARGDIVEVHAPARAAEVPGDGVVGARRLVRRPMRSSPERISA
jgi:hypothetical protein